MKPFSTSILALLGSCALLPAATLFTENFSSETSGPNLTLGTGLAGATTSFAGATTGDFTEGDFKITSGTGSRIYLGTNDTDYFNSAVDFVFQATVTVPNTDAWAIAFFGMGNSTAGGTSSSQPFGEPVTGSDLFMVVRNDLNRLEDRDNVTTAAGTVRVASVPTVSGGTHLLRMTWNATSKSAFFEYDSGNNGSIDGSFTMNGADNGFNGTNSQLVLGGGNGLVFDNVSVTAVPEPSVALLGGFGMLGLLRRRRS